MKIVAISLILSFAVALSALDVKSCGARGDGVADDSAALREAVTQLKAKGDGTLEFPTGTYRIGTVRGGLVFDGISNVTVNFAEGAVLLMDNLQPDGMGGGHGMVFRAPAENIELNNVRIVWKEKPKQRSSGDGLRFEGFPEDSKTLRNIRLNHCRVENSAQTGAVFMGCSDIAVRDFTIVRSWADGLHFNACRRIVVDGVTGEETGDDTLAFVTYYAETFSGKTGGVFALPDLGEWNNSGAKATNVRAAGGGANGVRIAGAKDVAVSGVKVERKSCGVIVDAGPTGKQHRWQYLASKGIALSDAEIAACDTGFYVWQFNTTLADGKFSGFDVKAERFRISGCANDSVHLAGVSGVTLKEFESSGRRWRLRTFRDCSVERANISGASLLIIGVAENVAEDVANLTDNHSVFRDISLAGGMLELQNCRKTEFENLRIADSPAVAWYARFVFDSSFKGVRMTGVNRSEKGKSFAVQLLQSRGLQLDDISVAAAGPLSALIEIGGGNAKLRSGEISVTRLSGPEGVRPFLLQGGPYAPEKLAIP